MLDADDEEIKVKTNFLLYNLNYDFIWHNCTFHCSVVEEVAWLNEHDKRLNESRGEEENMQKTISPNVGEAS